MASSIMPLDKLLGEKLIDRAQRHQYRELTQIKPGTLTDFSSNSYLSLSTHPTVRADFMRRIMHRYQQSTRSPWPANRLLGSGGSRLLDGNSPLAESMEKDLATYHRAPAALFFNSAMEANTGLISTIPQREDVFIYDEFIHASMFHGMKLSKATLALSFAHNVARKPKEDEYKDLGIEETSFSSLEEALQHLLTGHGCDWFKKGNRNVFIIVEAVYSMNGDVAPLRKIVDVVEEYLPRRNGYIIVDEAHSTGLFDRGAGLVCHLGLEKHIYARVLGFGKAIDCAGGLVLCSRVVRAFLINYSRSFIYTTAMAIPSLISIQAAYTFLVGKPEEAKELIQQVQKTTLFHVSPDEPQAPIVPIFTCRPRSLARHCRASGYSVRAIVAPTVPRGTERVRVCVHASNSLDEVKGLCTAIEAWILSQLGLDEDDPDEFNSDDSYSDGGGSNGPAKKPNL
ncbi:pyridoxal phosphate-dependent transferase [Podospora didyma]|uniref:Pyridoxal phosphate-dependent transferase n=1 Tax=Podospora didyma TaxID=330526 RepID=A0AAE0U052_9PEZI|nr:pyridoxal phosphate-dependent transferase [Podospora didyma]